MLRVQEPVLHAPRTQRRTMGVDCTIPAAVEAHVPAASGRPQDLGGYSGGTAHRSALARCHSQVWLPDHLLETAEGVGGVLGLADDLTGDSGIPGNGAEAGSGTGLPGRQLRAGKKGGAAVELTRRGRPVDADPIPYAKRWIIERTTASLQNFRRVLVRHDRLLATYRAFVLLACVMITLGALLK